MMDRIERIRESLNHVEKYAHDGLLGTNLVSDTEWLIAEVDRLRKIEDAILEWQDYCNNPGTNHNHASISKLHMALRDNPRPETDDA